MSSEEARKTLTLRLVGLAGQLPAIVLNVPRDNQGEN
jgi:hypothetical protein